MGMREIINDDTLTLTEKLARHYDQRSSAFDDAFMNRWGPRAVLAMMVTGTPLAVCVVMPYFYEPGPLLYFMQVRYYLLSCQFSL